MKKVKIDPTHIDFSSLREVVDILLKGGLVVLPTETVYGIGAVYGNKQAEERLCKVKEGWTFEKSFSISVESVDTALSFFSVLPPYGFRLIEKFWPGPLTIVFYDKDGSKTLGIRVSSHKVLNAILKEVKVPLYLPSASINGKKEAVCAGEAEDVFKGKVDLIVDSGPSFFRKASTVIDLTYNPFKVLREGVIPSLEIERVFYQKRILFVCTGNTCRSPMAEYLFRKYFFEKFPFLREKFEIISRGIASLEGGVISSLVAELLSQREGIDAWEHRTKRLTERDILSSDLIFVMEKGHREYILDMVPTAEPRVFLLGKFLFLDEVGEEIPDPIGMPHEGLERVYELIKGAVKELIEWIGYEDSIS